MKEPITDRAQNTEIRAIRYVLGTLLDSGSFIFFIRIFDSFQQGMALEAMAGLSSRGLYLYLPRT
jgi:hypothetical protein